MQLNCTIASLLIFYLNHLCDAITARVLHSNCVYCPVGITTLIMSQFIIKQAVKLNSFTSKQYWHELPSNLPYFKCYIIKC